VDFKKKEINAACATIGRPAHATARSATRPSGRCGPFAGFAEREGAAHRTDFHVREVGDEHESGFRRRGTRGKRGPGGAGAEQVTDR
jgi:hypothetical protein